MENPTTQTYHITETKRCYQIWEYTVEATSQEEALRLVMDGDVESDYTEVQEDPLSESEYEFE